ncbi:MAG: HNH endonuclease [Bacteroidota bacterium]|nr:HNH endonuclease [Bacteroidota bacterium]
MKEEENRCLLCGRRLADPCNRHHLLPLSKGVKGTHTILLHKICHDAIHSVFTEAELKNEYNTIEKLQQNAAIKQFVKWVRKKEPEYYDKSNKKKR